METTHFFAPGKLMITGEYVVLQGARSLSLPTIFGQHMDVRTTGSDPGSVHWKALDENGTPWLDISLEIGADVRVTEQRTGSASEAEFLTKMLSYALESRGEKFLGKKYEVETRLDFPRNWGLGSSSTFAANFSRWLDLDPWELYRSCFQGSGYDLATSLEGQDILFQLTKDANGSIAPSWECVQWEPPFQEQIWFVHLGQKQDSQREVAKWRSAQAGSLSLCIREDFDAITEEIIRTAHLTEFEFLIRTHEKILASLLNTTRIKESLFPDYPGEVKSLGAWGGDFILATGNPDDMNYFRKRGFTTVRPFSEMILRTK